MIFDETPNYSSNFLYFFCISQAFKDANYFIYFLLFEYIVNVIIILRNQNVV